MSSPSNAVSVSHGDVGSRRLLGSVLIAAGVVLLVITPAFLLGQGPVAGSELDTQVAQPADPSVADGSTLLLLDGNSSPDSVEARLLSIEPAAGSPSTASGSPGGPAAAPAVLVEATATAPPPPPTATSAPVALATAPLPTTAPPPTAVPPTLPPPPPPTSPPTAAPTATPVPPPQKPSVALSGFEADIFAGTNSERVAAGLAPLQLDSALIIVARERSDDMVQKSYFAHVSPTGETAFTIMDRYGIPYGWAGENLARNNYPDTESVAVAMRDWMASQGHRENILNVHYTAVGVGAAVDGAGMKYFTVVFTGPGP